MESTPIPVLAVHPLIAVTILCAIPVAMYALWADYYSRYLQIKTQPKVVSKVTPLQGEDSFNPAEELQVIRSASLYSYITLFILYWISTPFRQGHLFVSATLFLVSIFLQTRIQLGLENQLRGPDQKQKAAWGQSMKTLLWCLVLAGIYFGSVRGMAEVGYQLALRASADKTALALAFLGGGFSGILTGLAIMFALGPLHLHFLLRIKRAVPDESSSFALIESIYKNAGLKAPRIYWINREEHKSWMAMTTGLSIFHWLGLPALAPTLFMSEGLNTFLTHNEMVAVISHEVAHTKLHHMGKRMSFIFGTIAAMALTGITVGVVSVFLFPPALLPIIHLGVLVAAAYLPFKAIRAFIENQEFEADQYAVFTIAAEHEALISALKRLDAQNAIAPEKDSATHPSTERRIMKLRASVLARLKPQTHQESQKRAA